MRSQHNSKSKRKLRKRPPKLRILEIKSENTVEFEQEKNLLNFFDRAAKYMPLCSLLDILILCYASNSMDSMNAISSLITYN